jgi:hypothetical protein
MIELTVKDWENAIKEMEVIERHALINLETSRNFIEVAKKKIEDLEGNTNNEKIGVG